MAKVCEIVNEVTNQCDLWIDQVSLIDQLTGSALMLTSGANAAASLDFTGATEELTGVQTAVVGIIGTLVVLIGIGIAWSYFKRTAK